MGKPQDSRTPSEKLLAEIAALKAEVSRLVGESTRKDREIKLLEDVIAGLKQRIFGRKSEKVDASQLELELEAAEGKLADLTAAEQAEQPAAAEQEPAAPAAKRKGGGRRPLPENLPVQVETIDIPQAPREGMEKIREEVTDRIEFRRSQFFILRTVRPVYARADKSVAPVCALAPVQVIPGSGVGTGLLAHVLVSRFADHLPYYRIEQIAARQGVPLERQKLCGWVEHLALLLKTVRDKIADKIRSSPYIQVDETPVTVLDPDRNRANASRKAWLWAYQSIKHKSVLFDFHLSRGDESPRRFFSPEWSGAVQTDGYAVYPAVFRARPGVSLVGCWAHARRHWMKSYEVGDPVGLRAMAAIQRLYRIEEEIRQLT